MPQPVLYGAAYSVSAPKARARMTQAIGILDNHAYPDLVWGLYVEQREAARQGRPVDAAKIARLTPRAETCLAALESLADLHAAPMFALFLRTPEGEILLPRHPRLTAWWQAVSARPSFVDTAA